MLPNFICINLECQHVLFLFKILHHKQISVVFIPQTDWYNKIICPHKPKLTIFALYYEHDVNLNSRKVNHVYFYIRMDCLIKMKAILENKNMFTSVYSASMSSFSSKF